MEPGTGRLEAFSDGVFAIAATLLVLEFSVHGGSRLGSQLLHLWPAYLAYVTSFVTIGIIWMNHHHTVSLLGRTDRTMLFVNNLLLLTVAFLPFPTRLVAEDLHHAGEKPAALAYAATLVVMAALHLIWWGIRASQPAADRGEHARLGIASRRPRVPARRADVRDGLRRRVLQPARRPCC